MVKQKKTSAVPKEVVTKEDVKKFKEEIMKLPADRAGLPGNVIPLYIVPRNPAQSAGLTRYIPAHEFHIISEGLIDHGHFSATCKNPK